MIRQVSLTLAFLFLASCRSAPAPAITPADAPGADPSIEQPAEVVPTATVATAPIEKTPTMVLPDNRTPALSATPTDQGISQEMDAQIPPIPPAQLSSEWQDRGIMLSWLGTGSDIDIHYIVYRRQSQDNPWQVITQIAVKGDNRSEYRFLDTAAEAGTDYSYAVTTVNRYGKESEKATIDLTGSP